MSTRTIRTLGRSLTLLLSLIVVTAYPSVAQESTPITDPPVTVGDTEISWTGDWDFSPLTSSAIPDQGGFSQVDIENQTLKLLSIGFLVDETITDGQSAVSVVAEEFLEGTGARNVVQVTAGELSDGTAWGLYTLNPSEADDVKDGLFASFITASANDDGSYVVTSLTTSAELLEQSITQVQSDFVLNGESQVFPGVVAAEVTEELPQAVSPGAEAAADATPIATPSAATPAA